MASARLFYRETEQDKICRIINTIAVKNIQEYINTNQVPVEFGKEFYIQAEGLQDHADRSRYFEVYFMDQCDHPKIGVRRLKNALLEVNDMGQLILLDNKYIPMETFSRFTFRNGMLELHTQEWLEENNIKKGFCNFL